MPKFAVLCLASAGALTAAAASAASSDVLTATTPWWEKVTVTMAGDQPESCRYESSLTPTKPQTCDVSSDQAATVGHASKGDLTRITFERRFTPGVAPAAAKMQTGDTLLGGQVMALAIDAHGKVYDCKIVSAAGDIKPGYGCNEASAERFNASAGAHSTAPAREGYMTILVYGHSEHVV